MWVAGQYGEESHECIYVFAIFSYSPFPTENANMEKPLLTETYARNAKKIEKREQWKRRTAALGD